MKQFSVIVIGAGARGWAYAKPMRSMPDKFKIVGVAEPVERRREDFKRNLNLPDEAIFNSWQEILSRPKMADIAIIATMDDMHYEPAMKAIELGYDLLLEKPVAQTEKECTDIANAAKEKGVSVLVCHVLRYTPFFKKVKSIVESGKIGEIMSIVHVEAVGDVHQSHSYIRGNWHSEKETTPMLLAKSCHDLDIIQWLIDKPCKKVSSFGDLTYFTEANAPEGAPRRCADGGCPIGDTCPYNCMKLYYDDKDNRWFRDASTRGIAKHNPPTDEEVMEALRTTDYGLCVFHANNDVVDHQVVNMQFEGGATASFSMNAFNKGGRYIRIFGTKGEIYANMSDETIHLFDFETRRSEEIPVQERAEESILGGHGGGDDGIVQDFYEYLAGTYEGSSIADIQTSVCNHLIGFAAEEARHNDTVVDIDKFFVKNNYKNEYPKK
jgi:predicted dehydrogenase